MCYWVLPEYGIPIVHSTMQSITEEQQATKEVRLELASLNNSIKRKLGDPHEDDSIYTYDLSDPNINDDESLSILHQNLHPLNPKHLCQRLMNGSLRLMTNISQQKLNSHEEVRKC
jgi:hypothetical protein